jgi:hypothetical protein
MSHHGREGTQEDYETASYYSVRMNQLSSAVELIKALANGLGEDGGKAHGGSWATTTPSQACDKWLMDNGYECEATRAAQNAKKLAELEAQIAKLQQEKDKLSEQS